uniref:Histone-lysine N-methyltransferase n=1 Tax=Globisporangium ultimum (strain ATCC 200006 / CBS 805.95 / DAOM BR144) TaxID=431595 RepID=K3WJZ6_GLOUD
MVDESRKSGNRSVDVALAEIHIIPRNVYVERKERTLTEVLVECISGYCPCGDKCANQRIQHGQLPLIKIIDCGKKGLGLITQQEIGAGSFVGEYKGEIVTEKEYHMRRLRYHNEKHRYMMVLSGGEVIDATRMGGYARFINHSCEPNCGVEKWDVNGEERCGIFALRDIHSDEELTFDYKFESFSKLEMHECLCGSVNCRKIFGMNNRSVKPGTSKTSAAAGTGLPYNALMEKPKVFDPIGGKHRQGKKVADSLLDRIARMLFHRKPLSKKEMQFLRTSRVMLYRNLTSHLDTNFRSICLEMHFLSEQNGKLADVPDVFPSLRDLPRYLSRRPPEDFQVKKFRLDDLTEWLHDRAAKHEATTDASPPRLAALHL